MFETPQDFFDAYEGRLGREAEEAAIDLADALGLNEQWDAEDDAEGEEEYLHALGEELARVEHTIGRRLTQGEERKMINGISTEQFGQEVPNFVEQYASQLAEARDTEDGRVHLGAEAARQVMEEQGQEQAGSVELFEPPLSPAGDEGE